MKLKKLVKKYTTYCRSLGYKFISGEHQLTSFCRFIGSDIELNQISAERITAFLCGNGKTTSSWLCKYSVLLGFYRYLIGRGYSTHVPLPTTKPKHLAIFIPYIYTKEDFQKILQAVYTYQKCPCPTEPYMIHMLLLLLYGTGLRISEALSLTMEDIDLYNAVITVRNTKFYKSRLVPFNTQLAQAIKKYISWQKRKGRLLDEHDHLFNRKDGRPVTGPHIGRIFRNILKQVNIKRTDGCQPCLHSFRHTFAVHRLTSWYQEGTDVQKLLPILSVYMGHSSIASTAVYLKMTPELLHEAGKCFEAYVQGCFL